MSSTTNCILRFLSAGVRSRPWIQVHVLELKCMYIVPHGQIFGDYV